MSQEHITLCYNPNRFSRKWTCEYGFDSVKAADKRMYQLKENNEDIETRLFPTNQYTPKFLHRWAIQSRLTQFSQVELQDKPIDYKTYWTDTDKK